MRIMPKPLELSHRCLPTPIVFSDSIQGLRAIAVLAVIAFHFQPHWLVGGYVGVDMFFVISGFLITRMIRNDLQAGTFSFGQFYKNRVVRLLPNLFLMVATTIVIGYWVLLPYDFFQYAKSLQFSAIYLTNMVFANQQGYFDMSRDVKPLLHTWSLSIEEQFYLLLPLLLFVLFKARLRIGGILLVLGIASYGIRWRYTQLGLPSEGFFSFLGRIWEFMIGAGIAYLPLAWHDKLKTQPLWFWIGASLIFLSLIGLNEGLPYADALLLAPCLGTAILIMSSESKSARLQAWLHNKLLVFIGGMSYSLYLWHWPLMVWFHQSDWGLPTNLEVLLLTLVTALVSYAAWKYIETPFRRNKQQYSGKVVAAATIFFGIFCISAGGYIYAKSGLESRFPSYAVIAKNLASFDFHAQTGIVQRSLQSCSPEASANEIIKNCAIGHPQAKQSFLVLGDSHAGSWAPAFDAAGQQNQWGGVLLSLPGCPPLMGIQSWDGAKDICHPNFDTRLKDVLSAKSFNKVFLVAYWSMYSEGDERRPYHFISDSKSLSNDATTSKKVIAQHLKETIQYFNEKGIEVVIVHTVPTLPKRIQDLSDDYSQTRMAVEVRNRFMKDTVNPAQSLGSLSTLDAANVLCTATVCPTRTGGYVMYSDNNHISLASAAQLIPLVRSALK
ncbi:MAG: acyltransferase family protein [Cytophagales bacterium]|nr:acyltransferase family protein [Cytophagales bacterium]